LAEFSSARLANDETTWNSALRHASQLKHVVISGIGFFSDAYDLFIINIVLAILTAEMEGFGDSDQSAVSTAALAGAILGQLAFGFIADKVLIVLLCSCLPRCRLAGRRASLSHSLL
jgi:MFS family permease